MALQQEIWLKDIQESLHQNAAYLQYGIDDSAYAAFKTVHVPQSGSPGTMVQSPFTLPLTVAQRSDTELTYDMTGYAMPPILVTNFDELQISYAKRQSVTGQQVSKMTENIGNVGANNWSATGAANIVRTSGALGTTLAPGATGTRKAITLADVAALSKKLDKDLMPDNDRYLLMNSDMFWELFQISDLIKASYNGFRESAMATGVIAELFGFKILKRPLVSIYDNAGTPAKKSLNASYDYTSAVTDNLACVAWHKSAVSYAKSNFNAMYDAGSSGTGKPEMLGATFGLSGEFGAALRRSDSKGVVSLVQSA